MDISVIICTLNRVDSLAETLASLAKVQLVSGLRHELIVVDNGSSDGTARLLESLKMPPGWELHVVRETRKGLSCARNKGVAVARGKVLIFSDDDLRFPEDWISSMSKSILNNEADALAGHVQLAPQLCRPWMDAMHQVWFANTASMDFNNLSSLVGANMSFSRAVFEKVPFFDEELGAGALGFAEETLFAYQLIEAGYRLKGATGQPVLHFPDSSRFTRNSLLAAAKKRGQSSAYIMHHWHHERPDSPLQKSLILRAKIFLRRLAQPPGDMDSEGAPAWEISYFVSYWSYQSFMNEVRRERNYEKKGLLKKTLAKTAGDLKGQASPVAI